MTNIPTDLLRTLVAVVDQRSFTKAAAKLGVTQPAVSAQIKRLQFLLNAELFDRSIQGVSLTPQGETVVTYARRLLSINDQIVHIGGSSLRPELVIRVGTPSDFIASTLPATLAQFRERWPDIRFIVRTGYYEPLARQLHGGEIDLLIGLSSTPPDEARHSRVQEVVWVHSGATRIDPNRPVPLVSYGEACVYHQVAVSALRAAGRDWEDVFTGPSFTSLISAVNAGLGVMAVTRRRAVEADVGIWENAPLPKLPDLYSGIFIREGGPRVIYEQLADEIAAVAFNAAGQEPELIATARKAISAA
jgi:DNA-binding transcriptional LysR family regulator